MYHAISNFFGELTFQQTPPTEPEVTPIAEEPCSWHQQENCSMPTLKCILWTAQPKGS